MGKPNGMKWHTSLLVKIPKCSDSMDSIHPILLHGSKTLILDGLCSSDFTAISKMIPCLWSVIYIPLLPVAYCDNCFFIEKHFSLKTFFRSLVASCVTSVVPLFNARGHGDLWLRRRFHRRRRPTRERFQKMSISTLQNVGNKSISLVHLCSFTIYIHLGMIVVCSGLARIQWLLCSHHPPGHSTRSSDTKCMHEEFHLWMCGVMLCI